MEQERVGAGDALRAAESSSSEARVARFVRLAEARLFLFEHAQDAVAVLREFLVVAAELRDRLLGDARQEGLREPGPGASARG